MTSLALDTNAYRALDDGNVKLAQAVRSANQIGIPINVLGELYHGIFNGNKESENLLKLNHLIGSQTQKLIIN